MLLLLAAVVVVSGGRCSGVGCSRITALLTGRDGGLVERLGGLLLLLLGGLKKLLGVGLLLGFRATTALH